MADTNAFIVVKYGDNQDAIFNLSCASQTLLHWIRKKCRVADDEHIDLLDMDGDIRHLSSKETLLEYAYDILGPRETYILISVHKQENLPPTYTSRLHNLSLLYPNLRDKLEGLSRPHQHNSRARKSKQHKGKSLDVSKSKSRPTSSDRRSRMK